MTTVLNFSHPLSDVAKSQIKDRIGDFVEIVTKCQLDLDKPLKPQVTRIIKEGMDTLFRESTLYFPDYVVAPAFGTAAFWTGTQLSTCPVIWVKRTADIPPQFILGGIE